MGFPLSHSPRIKTSSILSNGVLYSLVFAELAEEFLTTYSHVTIGSANLVANHDITQIVEVCSQDDKPSM